MNSKKHKLPRRILAMLLAICMFVTMFPSAMFAVEGEGGVDTTQSQTVKVDKSDSNVSISKEATRVDATTWNVTMTVNAHQDIQAVPLDVVLVLDTSPSMEWDLSGDDYSYPDKHRGEQSRLEVVQDAAQKLIDELAAVGNVNVGLVQFHGSGSFVKNLTSLSGNGAQTIKDEIDDLDTKGHSGTNITSGLSKANEMLSGRSATDGANKVVILLSDGEYTDGGSPQDTASSMKKSGIEIFSIGFADQGQAANTLRGIASEPKEDHFFQADNATQLVDAFTDIAYEVTAMINDNVGTDVTIDANTLSATIDGQPDSHLVSSGTTGFRWNPDTEQGLKRGQTLTITYQVTLNDDDAADYWGNSEVVLNQDARLNYRLGDNGKATELNLNPLKDTVDVAQLTIYNQLDDAQPQQVGESQYVFVYSDTDTAQVPFSWTAPSATWKDADYNKSTLMATDISEDVSDQTTYTPESAGEYQLVHKYTSQPQTPDKPGDDVVIDAFGEIVNIDCINDSYKHAAIQSKLLDGTFNVSDPAWNEAENAYTVEVTVTPAEAYATAYNNDSASGGKVHTLVTDPAQENMVLTLKYVDGDDPAWTPANESKVTVQVQCPDPQNITGITKEVVTKDDVDSLPETLRNAVTAGTYDIPENNKTMTFNEGDKESVTLLYKITVTGDPGTSYEVKDPEATFVDPTSGMGEIPDSSTATLYVSRTFDLQVGTNTFINSATVTNKDEGNVPEDDSDEDTVTVEVVPDGPTDGEVTDAFGGVVKLDCVGTYYGDAHTESLYSLPSGGFTIGEPTKDEDGSYYVTITVDPNEEYMTKYEDLYNAKDNTHNGGVMTHTMVEGQKAQTLQLEYVNGEWVKPDNKVTYISFKLTCADPQNITEFKKEVVTSSVEGIDGTYQYPTQDAEGNLQLSVESGTDVTLLYKIIVTGNKNVEFTVTDEGTTLVKVEGATGDGLALGTTDSYTGTITGDNGAVLYVAKNFGTVDSDRDLENTAAVVNESGGTQPDPDGDDEVVVPVEVTYTLNYDANGGKYLGDFSGKDVATVSGLKNGEYAIWTKDDTGKEVGTMPENEILPVHDPVEENDVLFIGWSLKEDDKIYERGDIDALEALHDAGDMLYTVDDKVTIEDANATLYAVWGYDKDKDGTPDVFEEKYTLTYDINGGYGTTPVDKGAYITGDTVTLETEAVPDHEPDSDGTAIVFLGWSTTQTSTIYGAGENYGEVVTDSVTFADKDITVYAVWGYDTNGDGIADATQVFITPADITVYTGGDVYGGVVDAEGNEISTTENAGLPEPGYFITLPYDVQSWLTEQTGTEYAANLSDYLEFTYNGTDSTETGTTSRTWTLVDQGVYDRDENGNVARYVYSLNPATVDGEQIPVRLTYFDDADNDGQLDNGETVLDNDAITMAENLTSDQFKMIINPGELNQQEIKASFKTTDGNTEGTPEPCTVAIGTGTLTVKSVVNQDTTNTNSIVSDANSVDTNVQTAVADDSVEYYVNDSEVQVPVANDRVQLLVDSVSNNEEFNASMGQDAIATVGGNTDTHDYELVYMDLVDTQNGNVEVTLGDGDSLTIYWPMPEDADENGTFQVVHYTDMDREETVDNLGDVNTETPTVTKTTIDGQVYLTFTVNSFSPFALVYETDNGGSDTPDNPGWTPDGGDDGPDGLNTEDHFSYIVGYAEDYRTGEPTDNEDLWPVKPNNQITRAEVATIFYRLLEDEVRDEYDTTVNDFSDVSADSWYNQTVSTLASMGIVKGYEDGTFRPNEPITRAEFGAIATRFFAETGATYEPGTFSDVTGDEWYANAIQDAVNLGLIGGYEDGTVRPNNNITRAEACAIVNRTLGRVPDADHLLPDDVMKTWPDNPESAWFYADMQEATNGHEYSWITEDGNEVEEWISIMLDNDWTDR